MKRLGFVGVCFLGLLVLSGFGLLVLSGTVTFSGETKSYSSFWDKISCLFQTIIIPAVFFVWVGFSGLLNTRIRYFCLVFLFFVTIQGITALFFGSAMLVTIAFFFTAFVFYAEILSSDDGISSWFLLCALNTGLSMELFVNGSSVLSYIVFTALLCPVAVASGIFFRSWVKAAIKTP